MPPIPEVAVVACRRRYPTAGVLDAVALADVGGNLLVAAKVVADGEAPPRIYQLKLPVEA